MDKRVARSTELRKEPRTEPRTEPEPAMEPAQPAQQQPEMGKRLQQRNLKTRRLASHSQKLQTMENLKARGKNSLEQLPMPGCSLAGTQKVPLVLRTQGVVEMVAILGLLEILEHLGLRLRDSWPFLGDRGRMRSTGHSRGLVVPGLGRWALC